MPEELNNQNSTPETPKTEATTTQDTSSTNTSNTPAPKADEVTTPPATEKVETPEEKSALEELGVIKDDDKKPEDKKPDDTKEAEEYEIALADNSPLTEADLDAAVALAEKHNWTKAETEAFLSEREQVYNRGLSAIQEQAKNAIKAEKEKLLADPDFKGEKLAQSLEAIDLVVSKYGDEEFKKYLKGPGGNHLPLAKMLVRLGNLMKADTIQGKGKNAPSAPEGSKESAFKNLYPAFFTEN